MHRKTSSSRSTRPSGDNGYARVASITDKGGGATSSGHVKVVVRVRPPNTAETSGNFNNIIRIMDEHVLVFDPKEQASDDFYQGKRRRGRDLNKRSQRDVRFAFDWVYNWETKNSDVYENTTKLILNGILDGYNGSVFAYGATGAGKTFTMLGNYDNPGVIFLTMMDLYQRIEALKDDKTCDVAVSYLEVYNEQIFDLLVPKGFLPIREDPQKGVIVSGLSLHKPKNAEELLQMLSFGNKNRTQHPTDANAESSRSHAVFQVFVRQRDRTANISADVRVAKMSLIDLAGSERATATTNQGNRFREGANINKSLLALGNCINALAEGKSKGYIPYRNSKLTRLLKDSLGGNCRTVMIAAISPSAKSYEDTYNTLNYANRAKNIKAELKRNVLSVDFHISKYAKICEELRQEVSELKGRLTDYESGSVAVSGPPKEPAAQQGEMDRLTIEMRVVFEDRRNIRQELLELESKERDLAIRLYTKERCLLRLKAICAPSNEKASGKISHMIETTRLKQERVQACKQRLRARMDQNAARINQVQADVANCSQHDAVSSELLECRLKAHHQEIDLHDTKRHVRSLQNIGRYQQHHASTTEKLLVALLQAYHKVYYILMGHHLASSDLTSQYEAIHHLVEGEREVAWADQIPNDSQLITDPDKPLLDHILKFPTLGSRMGRRSSIMATPKPAVAMTPPVAVPQSVIGSACDVPPGICTPGPPPCASRILAMCNETPTPPVLALSTPGVPYVPVPSSKHHSTPHPSKSHQPATDAEVHLTSLDMPSPPTLANSTPGRVSYPGVLTVNKPTLFTNTPTPPTLSSSASNVYSRHEHMPPHGTPHHAKVNPPQANSNSHPVGSITHSQSSNLPRTLNHRTVDHVSKNLADDLDQLQSKSGTVQDSLCSNVVSNQISQDSLPSGSGVLQEQKTQHGKLTKQLNQSQSNRPISSKLKTPQAERPIKQLQDKQNVERSHNKQVELPQYILNVVKQQPTTSHYHTQEPRSMDGTFTLIDGIVPLENSPVCAVIDGTCNRLQCSDRVQATPHRPMPTITSQTITISNSLERSEHKSLADVTATPLNTHHHGNINGATVTKATDSGSTEIKQKCSSISSGTITKPTVSLDKCSQVSKPVVIDDRTTTKVPPDQENRDPDGFCSVKRSMDFSEDLSSPAGRLTFADAVKSPGLALTKQSSSPDVRSPLARCDNIQSINSKHQKPNQSATESGIPSKQRRVMSASSKSTSSIRTHSALGGPRNPSNTQRSSRNPGLYTQNTGLPSAIDRWENNCRKSASKQPKYMQLTRSASVKRSTNHQRSQSVENSKGPKDVAGRRVANDENRPAHRQLFNARSKSVSRLPQRERVGFF